MKNKHQPPCSSCFILQVSGSSCFILQGSGSSCFILQGSGSSCFILQVSGSSCFILQGSGSSCFILQVSGSSCFILPGSGSSCFILQVSGSSCFILHVPGSSCLFCRVLVPRVLFSMFSGSLVFSSLTTPSSQQQISVQMILLQIFPAIASNLTTVRMRIYRDLLTLFKTEFFIFTETTFLTDCIKTAQQQNKR